MSHVSGYDPFVRGPWPVGVRGANLVDRERADRVLPADVWYPAEARHAGQDLDSRSQDAFAVLADAPPLRQAAVRDAMPADGHYALLLFSHTSAGHRRQSSFLCTHLASHGYVVAAVDHTGTTIQDATERAALGATFTPREREAFIARIIGDRIPDLRFLLDQVLCGAAGDVAGLVDRERVGLIGWSFGGWAALAFSEVDDRAGAVVALAPGGNSRPLPGIIPATLTFAWTHEVPTLYLVAEHDRFTPLPGQYELFARTPSSKQLFILNGADHGHFGDEVDDAAGCSPEAARTFTRGLTLAHLDAVLKDAARAQRFLAEDAIAALRTRGVSAVHYDHEHGTLDHQR